jgi:hypothetical protein
MFNKKIAAVVAASVMMASTPAFAQVAPAAVQPQSEQVAGNAQFEDWGTEAYVIAAVVGALIIWGFIELLENNDDEAVSPT